MATSSKNNRADNLRWDTPANNQHDRVIHGTDARGEKHALQWITDEQIHQIRRWISKGWTQRAIADKIGCSRSHIGNIKQGKKRQHLDTPGLWMWSEKDREGRWLI